MYQIITLTTYAVIIGSGATATMDLWALLLKRCFAIPSLNYAMVGRWIGHFPRKQFIHQNIAQSTPIKGELFLGWFAHYVIGIVFAGLLLMLWGTEWILNPTLLPAIMVGIITVVAPFFIMQPGMGAGIAASKTPKPNTARFRSLMAHTVFGLGLYITAQIVALIM